jgi:hypothetical protein
VRSLGGFTKQKGAKLKFRGFCFYSMRLRGTRWIRELLLKAHHKAILKTRVRFRALVLIF